MVSRVRYSTSTAPDGIPLVGSYTFYDNSSFLNGYLEQEIFVEQPQGFEVQGKEDKCTS